jgi:DNA topoisomerase-1
LTRSLENKLEDINTDKTNKESVVDEGEKEVKEILGDISKNTEGIGSKLYEAYQASNIVGECGCGGKLVKRNGRYGNFVGCTNYPDCNVTYSLPRNASVIKKTCEKCGLPMIAAGKGKNRQEMCLDPNCGKEATKNYNPEVVGQCPKCGKDLLKRSGRFGDFVGCSGFPKCKFTCSLEELESKLS